jgi:hypothetical protein
MLTERDSPQVVPSESLSKNSQHLSVSDFRLFFFQEGFEVVPSPFRDPEYSELKCFETLARSGARLSKFQLPAS